MHANMKLIIPHKVRYKDLWIQYR